MYETWATVAYWAASNLLSPTIAWSNKVACAESSFMFDISSMCRESGVYWTRRGFEISEPIAKQ